MLLFDCNEYQVKKLVDILLMYFIFLFLKMFGFLEFSTSDFGLYQEDIMGFLQ